MAKVSQKIWAIAGGEETGGEEGRARRVVRGGRGGGTIVRMRFFTSFRCRNARWNWEAKCCWRRAAASSSACWRAAKVELAAGR